MVIFQHWPLELSTGGDLQWIARYIAVTRKEIAMPSETMNSECIENCSQCSATCYSMAINHCLQLGGKHVEQHHFSLMLECAKVCETSACLQRTGSTFSTQFCGLCAQVCEACAASCESVGEMDECVEVCRRCAESCRKMAA